MVAAGALSAALTSCSSDTDGDAAFVDADPGAPAVSDMGPSAGSAAMAGVTGVTGAAAVGANTDAKVCVPGVPPTSQIPRLRNRQYEAAVRDLLGVEALDQKPLSEHLVADFDGPMTPDAWRIYQDVGAQIASTVMSGPMRSRFIACDPAAAGCMDETIRTFGRKAFRRPLTDAEVARFQKLGQTQPAGTPDEVAETTLWSFLVSPSFLLLPELNTTADPTGQGVQLSAHEVATRLSFLLWGSVPDDTLDAAADANQLSTPDQILNQARRMIAVREKTGPLVSAFHRDWVQMNNGNAHWWKGDHDPKTYPLYSATAKVSWQAELNAFFEDVALKGGSFADLLLSNVAYVNQDNAAIYGLDASQYGAELTRVELDAAQRPGFMTRAGFLSSYSGYNATSPILRGAFISVYMLGVNPGPPIPGAAMMTVQGNFKTQRAYVEALTKNQPCNGCHAIVNPPGFVLESYDGIGKWQTVDPRGGAIDASVTTANVSFSEGKNEEVSSALQLMQGIAQSLKAKQLYAQAWVSYAYGRDPNSNDRCVVEQLATKLSQDGYSILDLLSDLTQADSFRLRARQTP